MNIRRQVSDLLGVSIPADDWDQTWDLLDRENRLNQKTINKILLVILKKIEELENGK